ncbi:MAG: B12-binding domain-containing radical SAM protein, partial [Candidatus Aminicenantes bacterium]|nr:B12-binding domain-containing radical SAM protein [Candidatus Aminicenantes bacterium]
MRVLLIHPPYVPFRIPLNERPVVRPPAVSPLGLGSIAAVLRAQGHDVVYVDHYADRFETVRRTVAERRPEVVGFPCLTEQRLSTFACAGIAREEAPEARIVLGGPHASALWRQILTHLAIDAVVIGEGESQVGPLVAAWAAGRDPEGIPGIAWRRGEEIASNGPAPLIADLDALPIPELPSNLPLPDAREILDAGIDVPEGAALANIVSSRGCPWACRFCSASHFWRAKWRFRSAESVLEEIRARHRAGARVFVFQDDNFAVKTERARAIAEGIAALGDDVRWTFMARINHLDTSLLDLFRRSGCIACNVGLESGSPEIQRTTGKKLDLDLFRRVARAIRDSGIRLHAFLMVGNPGESDRTIDETVSFIREVGPDSFSVLIATVYPETGFAQDMEEMGALDESYWLTDGPPPYYLREAS